MSKYRVTIEATTDANAYGWEDIYKQTLADVDLATIVTILNNHNPFKPEQKGEPKPTLSLDPLEDKHEEVTLNPPVKIEVKEEDKE
jgi:hypothetical protein